MAITQHEINPHLNYFLCLEDDIEKLSRWIEFSVANENTYSIELARLLMTASAETDVIAKQLCKSIDARSRARTVDAYQKKLMEAIPMLPDAMVEMPKYGLSFRPWANWRNENTPPDWWTGNNKVKHHRAEHFNKANLKNVLNSTAGLLVFLLLFHRSLGEIYLHPTPRLFVPRLFAIREGAGLRLLIPDGTNLPWGEQ
jgi:hypothetical protein